jgi:general secretion pathway protein G
MFVVYRRPGEGRDLRTRSRGGSPRDPGLRRGDEAGFTLVEMMVVIVIIGLLATIVIINVMPAADRAAVTKARADISTLEQGIEMFRLDTMRYPTTEEGLQALVTGNHIRRLPNDPWNRPYLYAAPGQNGRPFSISTLGADGQQGGDGENADITN